MSAYRQPTPPPPEPPDRDLERLARQAVWRARVVRWGPFVGGALVWGLIVLFQGSVAGILTLVGLLFMAGLAAAGRLYDRWLHPVRTATEEDVFAPRPRRSWRAYTTIALAAFGTMPTAYALGWNDDAHAQAWATLFQAGGFVGLVAAVIAFRAWDAATKADRVAREVRAMEASLGAASARARTRVAVGGVRRDDVANPAQEAARAYPQTRRHDEPEDPAKERSVVELADAWDEEGEDGGDARIRRG